VGSGTLEIEHLFAVDVQVLQHYTTLPLLNHHIPPHLNYNAHPTSKGPLFPPVLLFIHCYMK